MGWGLRRRIKVMPGVHVNLGKKGVSSVSVGVKGASVTRGKGRMSTNIGIPGTGISHRKVHRLSGDAGDDQPVRKPLVRPWIWFALIAVIVLVYQTAPHHR